MHSPLALFGALTLIVIGSGPAAPVQEPADGPSAQEAAGLEHSICQPIFFAVLEGLYRDGVSNAIVDRMLEIDPATHFPANFVWACPICMPVIDALDVYRVRPQFRESKTREDTFGAGLAPALSDAILGGDPAARQKVIQQLVEGWVRDWIDAHRLTADERTVLQRKMEEGRKRGMEFLETYRGLGGSYAWMKQCPSCEASNGACRRK